MTKQAPLAARNGKASGVGGDRQIATGDQLATGCRGQRVHPGNHRLRHRLDGVHHLGANTKQLARLRQRGAGHVAKVVPGAEDRAVGRQNHAQGVALRHGAQGLCQFQHDGHGQRVALLGTIEGEGGDGAAGCEQQMFVVHVGIVAVRPGLRKRRLAGHGFAQPNRSTG